MPQDDALLGVDDELKIALASQTRRGRLLALAAIPAVIAVLAGELAAGPLFVWSGLAAIDAVAYFISSFRSAGRIAAQTEDPADHERSIAVWRRRAPLHAAGFGIVWGALPVLAAVGDNTDALWMSITIALAVLPLYVVTTASSRLMFAVGGGPIMAMVSIATVISSAVPHRLSALAVAYAGIAVVVHATLHRHLVASVRSRHVAETLASTLNDFMIERDPSTELLNRRSFIARLDTMLIERSADTVTVEIGNIRRLTAMNELYGEQFGDALIVHVGQRLSEVERHGGLAARLSGDEFVIATFGQVAPTTIRALVGGTFVWHERTATVDVATATVQPRVRFSGAEELVADAMFALRSGRRSTAAARRNRSGDTVQARRELVEELRCGMRDAGVAPWFQPIVDAGTRQVVSWEALVRWRHPTLGMITPDRLLPLCEMAALNIDLLELLLEDSVTFLHRLDEVGAGAHAVHVNIDAIDLRERSMPDLVLGSLHDGSIAPERIVLELTERDILDVGHAERAALGRLDAAGVHLAVDDFGTGYSSLSHLLDFPADHVKIDRRFVQHLPDDADSLTLVRGVISMAKGLGLNSVAEGVETEAAAVTLQHLGCDHLQGYLIAPALRMDEAIDWWVGTRSMQRAGADRTAAPLWEAPSLGDRQHIGQTVGRPG